MHFIGIDIGGTHTRVGAVDGRQRLLAAQRHSSTFESGDECLAHLMETLRSVCQSAGVPRNEILGIGLAVPGVLDLSRGAIARAVNLPQLEGYPLVRRLAEGTGKPVTLMTDADAATWGEFGAWSRKTRRENTAPARHESTEFGTLGTAEGGGSFVHLRLGTGIGCGWVKDGRPQPIEPRRTGHLSVLVTDQSPGAAMCRCGKRGCLDTVASGQALLQRARQLGFRGGLPELEAAYRQGHSGAQGILLEAFEALASAIQRIAETLRPETICMGGGLLMQLGSISHGWIGHLGSLTPRITTATLGDDAGLLGAAALAGH